VSAARGLVSLRHCGFLRHTPWHPLCTLGTWNQRLGERPMSKSGDLKELEVKAVRYVTYHHAIVNGITISHLFALCQGEFGVSTSGWRLPKIGTEVRSGLCSCVPDKGDPQSAA
jgi:hypothetical protein